MSRILMFSPYFYPEGGGLEKYAFEMARDLSEENEVLVLCMTRGKSRVENMDGIKVYRIKPGFILSNTPLSVKFVLRAIQLVKGVDMLIAHTPVPFAVDVASFLAKIRRIPLLIVYHTVGLKKGIRFLDVIGGLYSSTIEKFTLRGSEIIAVSKIVWEYLKRRGYNSIISYPKITFKNQSSVDSFPSKKKVILFVGQLGSYHRFKNLEVLLEAFSEVSREFPDWELWVVGSGDLLDTYKQLAFKLGIGPKVRFLGRIEDQEALARVYSNSEILVLPSSFESFGMVVAEALSFNLPVIVSPHVGARILVKNGKNGFVLSELSVAELAYSLRLLIENPKLLRKLSSSSACRPSI